MLGRGDTLLDGRWWGSGAEGVLGDYEPGREGGARSRWGVWRLLAGPRPCHGKPLQGFQWGWEVCEPRRQGSCP